MASLEQVQQYLAHWFQLGKPVVIGPTQATYLPNPVIQNGRHSDDFQRCWQQILAHGGRNCYLQGTDQTLDQLMEPTWEITDCARCDMPIPMTTHGISTAACPCFDLPLWPNQQVPAPRNPVSNRRHLTRLRQRLESRS